jgi:thymidine kinase
LNKEGFKFELITGPMSCGKTEELLRRLKRAKIAKKIVKVFSPSRDTRAKNKKIESRNGLTLDSIVVNNSYELMQNIDPDKDEIIGIDELQFFDTNTINVINALNLSGLKVIASGLDLDFKGEPFGIMPTALALAGKVDKLTAICVKCGSEYGVRSQRLTDGKTDNKNTQVIMPEGDTKYEARCLKCFEVPTNIKANNFTIDIKEFDKYINETTTDFKQWPEWKKGNLLEVFSTNFFDE